MALSDVIDWSVIPIDLWDAARMAHVQVASTTEIVGSSVDPSQDVESELDISFKGV
jgi:hypothetical protein